MLIGAYTDCDGELRGIARAPVQYSVKESGAKPFIAGCADCDVELRKAIGFRVALGNMLAFDC